MSKRTPKITKNETTLLLFYVDTRKNLKAMRGNGYCFVPKGGAFPTKTIMLVVRSSYPNLAEIGQNFHHDMLMLLHDSMPSFMNSTRVLDLLEFKTRHLNVLPAINGAWSLKFIPISCMGPKHAHKDTYLIFQPIYTHWSMCM